MRRLGLFAAVSSLLLAPALAVPSAAAPDRRAPQPAWERVTHTEAAANPWLDMRVMNMAHSGGEHEAPMNTLYAFKRADRLGADMLELDVQSTKDGRLVVIHNSTIDDTTGGTGYVKDKTLRQLKRYDAAYWFVPGRSTVHGLDRSAYPLRGARNGQVRVSGYSFWDFTIPTLDEVFKAFPDTPINIEIKGTNDNDLDSFLRTGRLLADFLNRSGRTDVIVASFKDEALTDFHQRAPQIGLSPGMNSLINYYLFGTKPMEGTVALQVPVTYSGIRVLTDLVLKAQADGYAVHAWFSGSAPDTAASYNDVIDTCVDGLMPAKPTVLEEVLTSRGIERPARPGIDPCAP